MSIRERESASDSIIINTIYKRIRGEEGGTCEQTGLYFEINF